ncbi:low molecular weight phosphotyrosine protein phosphatase isoform X4 [Nilaparvata lugens]|uniref:low molecular weight phosphotyrosine protein phosphatase isoform X4 n=1 Tax=Nilaparvata lugens TaxID=108931 RepID=UPI00193EA84E|nr:low molecular weight phosphotyrosine protein phosphatase isoform X4 [Nilaparvata lugens]
MLETCKSENSALFICLGNICRSPIAEAVCKKVVIDMMVSNRWHIDSAAIGPWHVGNQPDHRALKTLRAHGLSTDHLCRQINSNDFSMFDYIFGMDEENMKALKKRSPKNARAQLLLLGSFDPNGETIIRDPYYDNGDAGFEKCYQQCLRSCTAFIKKIMRK